MEEEIDNYIKRAITDIAHKCYIKEEIVINHIKKLFIV
jgi:hypothetical protein